MDDAIVRSDYGEPSNQSGSENKEMVMSNGNQSSGRSPARGTAAGASAGESMVTRDDMESTEAMLPVGASTMLSKVTDADPTIKSMEPGDRVVGILEGYGKGTEFSQKNDMGVEVTNIVQTWIIKALDSEARLSILSSVQLDEKLPPFIGGQVEIIRGKDIKTSNNRKVADYMVKGKKVVGKTRTWARESPLRLPIEVSAKQLTGGAEALPPGGEDAQA